MVNFSTPDLSGSYSLNSEENIRGFTFLKSLISVLLNKDIFSGSLLSRDVFLDINIFIDKFQDCLNDNIYNLVKASPGILIITLTGLLLSLLSLLASVYLLYQCWAAQSRPVVMRLGRVKQSWLVLLLLSALAGCFWILHEARLVNRGAQLLPQVKL